MEIVSFIEEDDVIRKILKHCNLPAYRSTSAGRWKEPAPRPPPPKAVAPVVDTEPYYDFTFIEPAWELPFVKSAQIPLCPILVFTAEFDIIRPKFEEVAHWWMLNRVVHSTEIAGKLTLERGISYITSKYWNSYQSLQLRCGIRLAWVTSCLSNRK